MADKLLIIDDEQEWLDVLNAVFTRKGMNIGTANSGSSALKLLESERYDLILCDLSMPDLSGLDVLKQLRVANNKTPFIIMTGVGSIQTAVECIQLGAYNYITKPFKLPELESLVREAVAYGKMHRSIRDASVPQTRPGESNMVLGNDKALFENLQAIEKIQDSKVSILISGETGTGKSLLAQHIHNRSSRADKPFVTIECSSLQENILESELFGHVKGAFTGALAMRRGLLEEANGGTVFLDEIGELSLAMQAKLLSVLQNRVIRPVGGNKTIPIDVRFITATHRNLKQEVQTKNFREDLYYRIAVITLHLPPLRERRSDIIPLVAHFIKKCNAEFGKEITRVSPPCMKMLLDQPWRGNIRELEHSVERAVLLADGDTLTPEHFHFIEKIMPSSNKDTASADEQAGSLAKARKDIERLSIVQALDQTRGNRTKAAALLGIARRTLYVKMAEHHIGDTATDISSDTAPDALSDTRAESLFTNSSEYSLVFEDETPDED